MTSLYKSLLHGLCGPRCLRNANHPLTLWLNLYDLCEQWETCLRSTVIISGIGYCHPPSLSLFSGTFCVCCVLNRRCGYGKAEIYWSVFLNWHDKIIFVSPNYFNLFSLPIFLLKTVRICIIVKSEVWPSCYCIRLRPCNNGMRCVSFYTLRFKYNMCVIEPSDDNAHYNMVRWISAPGTMHFCPRYDTFWPCGLFTLLQVCKHPPSKIGMKLRWVSSVN